MALDIKLAFFDMEGTIFRKAVKSTQGIPSSAWTLLAQHLGEDALQEEEESKGRWNRNEYRNYMEWVADTICIHQKYGLKRDFFERVIYSVEYHPGVEEVFEQIREQEIVTVLISGGFKAQADKAQKDLRIDHSFAACEYFWDDQGNLVHWNIQPWDFEGKLDIMRIMVQQYGLQFEQCAFVGDGKNDVTLAREVGLAIAFNGAQELQDVCTYSINQPEGREDFRAILHYLMK